MGFNIVGFWAAGFTLGWALTFKAGLGLSGVWLGILSGSAVVGMYPHSIEYTDWQGTPPSLPTCAYKALQAKGPLATEHWCSDMKPNKLVGLRGVHDNFAVQSKPRTDKSASVKQPMTNPVACVWLCAGDALLMCQPGQR